MTCDDVITHVYTTGREDDVLALWLIHFTDAVYDRQFFIQTRGNFDENSKFL